MSCKAAILVLFNFTSARQGEEVAAARDLRCQLIYILANIAPTTSELAHPGDHQETEDTSADFAQPPPTSSVGTSNSCCLLKYSRSTTFYSSIGTSNSCQLCSQFTTSHASVGTSNSCELSSRSTTSYASGTSNSC